MAKQFNVVALVSGGKDSCYNMMECVKEGHKIVALANLYPPSETQEVTDEMDSFMYQTVGHRAIEAYAECMDVPLFRQAIEGKPLHQELHYERTEDDEVESLHTLLVAVLEACPQVNAVSSGAILSNYQRLRVESVCARLGLTSLAYMWRRDQSELLQEMIEHHVDAVLIKVAAIGLKPKVHLGRSIAQVQTHLELLASNYGCNVCGEGGEYETFTLDCPLFKSKIVLDKTQLVVHSDDAFAPVGLLKLMEYHTEPKDLVEYETGVKQLSTRLILEPEPKETKGEVIHEHARGFMCKPHVDVCIRGNMFSVSGLVSANPEDNATSQMENILSRLQDALERSTPPLTLKNLLFVSLFVDDMKNFRAVNVGYNKYFSAAPPSRSCIEVPLPEGTKIMMQCTGCLDLEEREVLHVQSISHWAPACIGPYSQAVKAGSVRLFAGQIALEPSTMVLRADSGLEAEVDLLLRNELRIMSAVWDVTPMHITQSGCFISHKVVEDVELTVNIVEKKVTLWVDEGSDTWPMQRIYVGVSSLPRSATLEFEMKCVAIAKPEEMCNTSFAGEKNTVGASATWAPDAGAAVSCIFAGGKTTTFDQEECLSLFVRLLEKAKATRLVSHVFLYYVTGDDAGRTFYDFLMEEDTLCAPCTPVPVLSIHVADPRGQIREAKMVLSTFFGEVKEKEC